VLFALAFAAAAALAAFPALRHDSLHTIYARTITYQSNRGSPFSVWGLYGGLHGLQQAVEIAAVALALALAVLPRRGDLVGLAAACAAAILATQLGVEHWFYLYIPWFFPLVMLALLGRFSDPARPQPAEASAPARSSQPATALSS
jgi:peptidoglycan/LPS O-acetylase OafA/YrhL